MTMEQAVKVGFGDQGMDTNGRAQNEAGLDQGLLKPAEAKTLVPRLYQQELFEAARKENVSFVSLILMTCRPWQVG